MDILVFKTNITDRKIKRKIFPLLRTIEGIVKWTVDFEDGDKILRVEALHVRPSAIEMTLQHAGFLCHELED
ncbi:MAG TPA: hypothetical protein PKM63_13355 [Panacibacter sp.]|nr:hypothetical protein [Panacibacter sp.]HNP45270.1 hypothetical protein [Panacibacter sp.]